MSALDVSDAFLQVLQREDVVVSVPNSVRMAAGNANLLFWQLLKCLPGQRNAATQGNEHLTNLLNDLNFEHMQGTLFRHRERDIFLSAHIDDLLLIASKEDTEEIYGKLSKQLSLKIDGPYGIEEPGKLFYLKRQVEVCENGIFIAPNSKYIPKLAELLGITERRGKTVPHLWLCMTPRPFLQKNTWMSKRPRCFDQHLAFVFTLPKSDWISNRQQEFFPVTWVGHPRPHFVHFENLGATWCRRRT